MSVETKRSSKMGLLNSSSIPSAFIVHPGVCRYSGADD